MGRKGVKKFTTWKYKDASQKITLDVPVYAVDRTHDPYRGQGEPAVTFRVELGELEIEREGTDIEVLQRSVFAEIKAKLAIEWRSVLVVEVEQQRRRLYEKRQKSSTPDTESTAFAGVTVTWERWQLGELNGQRLCREFANHYKPRERGAAGQDYWREARAGWPRTGDVSGSGAGRGRMRNAPRGDKFRMIIPDTPENREALELIGEAIEVLHGRLSRLLGTERIEQTLQSVLANGVKLLAAPAKQE